MPAPRSVGVVSASLLAVAGAALAPAFTQAANGLNFSAIQYGGQLEVVLSNLALVVALVALLLLGATLVR